MNPIGFATFFLFTLLTLVGITMPPPYFLMPIGFIFVAIPLIDFFLGEDRRNPNTEQFEDWRRTKVWAPALYFYCITHFIVLAAGVFQLWASENLYEVIFTSVVTGLYTGGLGITVAHELCHKKEFVPRFLANILLSSVCYQHFAVEHVRGHHLNVSTPHDPASARLNENIYVFLIRSISGSFTHALKIDRPTVLLWSGVSAAIVVAACAISFHMFVYFVLQSLVAIVLLEMVNYVEHYGLKRDQLPNGRYEKVRPIHSWNSAHKFSNYLLFNLQRHSDHHSLAHLPYTVLKHQEKAPQLPSGYPGMIILSLIPTLWFKIMNPKVLSLGDSQK